MTERPDIEAIEAREQASAAREWEIGTPNPDGSVFVHGFEQGYDHEMSLADATFITGASADIRSLAAYARHLESVLRTIRDGGAPSLTWAQHFAAEALAQVPPTGGR